MSNLIFRKMNIEETERLFQLIQDRMKWMDQVGIVHWNKYEYDKVYPLSYYEEKCKAGQVYVLVDSNTNELLSGAVLPEQDDNWEDEEPAYYIHNFVSKVGAKGVGGIFVTEVEKMAEAEGKKYVRLDVLETSQELADYYGSKGYVVRGRCQSGDYEGILREKKIS